MSSKDEAKAEAEAEEATTSPFFELSAPGEREVVDEKRAIEIVDYWKKILEEKKNSNEEEEENGGDGGDKTKTTTRGGGGGVGPHKIRLSDKSYTSSAAQILSQFFQSNPFNIMSTIKHADLSDIIASRMESEGLDVLETLCQSFSSANLVEVNLSDNAIGDKAISRCESIIYGQASTLEKLSLCNNGLSEHTMRDVAEMLTRPVEKKIIIVNGNNDGKSGEGSSSSSTSTSCIAANLSKIHFSSNMSGDGGCEAFARILDAATPSKLIDVRFSGTRAGRDGSMLVANEFNALATSTIRPPPVGLSNLLRLDLADNTFGTDGGITLAAALDSATSLTYLNLRDCCLEDEATVKICHALWSSGAPLVHWDVSGNELTGTKGAEAVAGLLEEIASTSLQIFHCEENELTSRGVRKIIRGIVRSTSTEEEEGGGEGSSSSSIVEMKLGTNECGRLGAKSIIDAASVLLPNLKVLELDNNAFPGDVVSDLETAFPNGILHEMPDNDIDEDVDDDVESDEEDDDGRDGDGSGDVEAQKDGDADVDELTKAVGNVRIDNLC